MASSTGRERKAAEALLRAVSDPTFSLPVFADCIRVMHPTHQQSLMRAYMATIDAWYEMYKAGFFDARNEGTVMASARMREALDQHPIALPYI